RVSESPRPVVVPRVGDWWASTGLRDSVVFWRTNRDQLPTRVQLAGAIADLSFSHDEKWLVVAGLKGGGWLIDPASGGIASTTNLHADLIRPLFAPNDSLFVVLGPKDLHVFRAPSWSHETHQIHADPDETIAFAFARGGHRVLVAEAGRVHRFELSPWR